VLAVAALAAVAARDLCAQGEGRPERIVTAVRFRGNDALDDYTLSISILTSASTWTYRWPILRSLHLGQRRLFDEIEFRRDVVRLRLLYRQHGYFEARVDTLVRRSDRAVQVTFAIAEGRPVLVDSIAIGGVDGIVEPRRLLRRLPLARGRPFDRYAFAAAADSLVLALRNLGYPFAAVYRNYGLDRGTRLARVSFELVPGPHARVGELVVAGAERVDRRTVRRLLGVEVGDEFDQDALYDSQRSLYQTNLFRYASVRVAPDSTVAGADSLVRILAQVAEGPRTLLRTGLGYGTGDCFRAQATVASNNFMGGARRLELAAKMSKLGFGHPTALGLREAVCPALAEDRRFSDTLNYLASLTFTQPAFLARRNALSITAFAERRSEFKAFERISLGLAASLSFGVGRDLPVTLTYRLANGRTNAGAATLCVYFDRCEQSAVAVLSESRRLATLSAALLATRTDSPIEPAHGHVYAFEAAHASASIGSELVFNKLLGEVTWYRTMARRWVAALRLRGGVVWPGRAVLADSAIRFVPPEERFYAGGPASVRGFGRNEMGPVVYVAERADTSATTGDVSYVGLRISPLGSNAVALANFELRLPSPLWPSRLRMAAFVDAGELWEQTTGSLVPSGLKVTPGFGLRVATPLGPMRLDAAYSRYGRQPGPLYVASTASGVLELADPSFPGPRADESFLGRITLHFSVGQAF
jgi:outer membrane protein assembly factor BamA